MPPDKAAATLDEQLREACTELDRRLRSGEPARTEDVLAELPELSSRPEFILELAYTEFVARDAIGESPEVEEWFGRFPELRQDLRELFEVHRFVEQSAAETLTPRTEVTNDAQRREQAAPVDTAPDADRRFGNYELLEEIGRGGMGVVYKARQLGLRRIVALKLILAGEHAGAERYERFQAEAETVGRLAHPNIVQIHEVGAEQGRPFLSLEFVDGGGLDRRKAGEPWPAREAAALCMTLARAMQHAHERGIVHRDLKPANVLMTSDGVPKITDFGLAKRLFDEQSGQTASGAMLGTPSYMAPEQALGNSRDSGVAADVYALGAILYELLTGRPPFRGASLLETLEQVRTQEPVGPRQLIGKLPRDLETICVKCLQKQPQHRYATAAALADDLERFLEHRPIQARPVNPAERIARWSARNPLLATLAASLVLLIATALVVGPIVAIKQAALRGQVQRQLIATRASLLAARSRMAADEAPQRSVLLAIEGIETLRADGDEVTATNEQALRDALARTAGVGLPGQRGPLTTVLFAPDGKSLISAGADGTARIWPVESPQSATVLRAHQGAIRSLAVSPSGRWLVTAGEDRVARAWDLRASDVAASSVELTGFRSPLVVATISPDERWLFVGDRAGAGKLYVMRDAAPPAHLADVDVQLPILCAAFSPDGQWLAVGGVDTTAHVWPLDENHPGEEHVLAGHQGAISALAFDPRHARLATASADHTLRIWDLPASWQSPSATRATQLPSLAGRGQGEGRSVEQRWNEELQFALDGLAANATRRSSRLHPPPVPSWKGGEFVIREPTSTLLTGHGGFVSCVAFSPDGRWLVSGSLDGDARRWDLNQPDLQTSCSVLAGHGDRVLALAISADSRWLATAARDRSVRVWDLAANDPSATSRVLRGHDDAPLAVAFDLGANNLVSASADGTARLFDLRAGLPSAASSRTYRHGDTRIQTLALSPSGRWLASCGNDAVVRVWDRRAGRLHAELPHDDAVQLAEFSADDRWLVTVEMAQVARPPKLWDLNEKPADMTPRALRGHARPIESLAIDPHSRWVIAGDQYQRDGNLGGRVLRWPLPLGETREGEVLARHQGDVAWLALRHDALSLTSVDRLGGVRVIPWENAGAPAAEYTLPGQAEGVRSFAAFPDGRRLATVDFGGALRLWEPGASNDSGTVATVLWNQKPSARHVVVSGDGHCLAALDAAGRVLIWRFDDAGGAAMAPNAPPLILSDAKSRGGALGCVISPDNRRLATFAQDGFVRIWTLDAPTRAPLVLEAHAKQVQAAHFTPDGRTLITAGYDGMVREWPLEVDDLVAHARRVAGRTLTDLERRQNVEE